VLGAAPAEARAGIALPLAETGETEYGDSPFVELIPTEGKHIWVNGEQAENIHAIGDLDLPREPLHLKGVSLRPFLITADRDLPWAIIEACLNYCLYYRISRVHLAVRRSADSPDTALLPTECPWLEDERGIVSVMDYAQAGPNLLLTTSGEAPVVTVTNARGRVVAGGPRPTPLGSPELPRLLEGLAKPPQMLVGEAVPWRLVHLKAQPTAPYRHVVTLIDACRKAGFDRIVFRRPGFMFSFCPLAVEPAVSSEIRRRLVLPVANLLPGPAALERTAHVAVTREGGLYARGRAFDLEALTDYLFKHAEIKRDMDAPSNPSKTNVLITGDARAPWRAVRSVMAACADPQVRIYRVYWSTETPEGEERRIDVLLPKDLGLAPTRPDATPQVGIQVDPGVGSAGMLLRSGRNEFGRGAEGLAKLAKLLTTHARKNPGLRAVLECAAELPFGDVVKVLQAVRSAGVGDVRFTGR
jgi:biopolymer transport protein ExbD